MSTETFVVSASGKATITKDPGTIITPVELDYALDWTDWLDAVGDNLVSVTATLVSDNGGNNDSGTHEAAALINSSPLVSGKTTVAWVKGGLPGEKLALTFSVVTDNVPPRKDDRTVYIKIKER